MVTQSKAAAESARKDLTAEDLEDLQEAFKNFDKDNSDSIDENELGIVLRSLGYSPTTAQIKELMDKVDTDKSGGISFDEFVAMMTAGGLETDFNKEMTDAFRFFDKDGNGEVTCNELAEIMRGLGDKLSDIEVALLLNAADKNGDGCITLPEFIHFMYN